MTAHQTVGYVRVSTEKQAEAGLSLEAQTAKIRAMAEVKGVALTEVLVDAGESAGSLDRPAMRRLLDLVEARVLDTIIIAKLDRLARSIADLTSLLKLFQNRGVSLVSINESLDTRSSTGRLVIHILGSVAEWERDEIGKRTSDVLQHKRAKGECVGTLPFGFQLTAESSSARRSRSGRVVQLEAAPAEQRLLAHMRELKAEGRSTRQIAATLTAEGLTTRRGTPWQFQNVAHAIRMRAS